MSDPKIGPTSVFYFRIAMVWTFLYAGVLVFLIAKRGGHVWGLDGWAENLPTIAQHPRLRALVH